MDVFLGCFLEGTDLDWTPAVLATHPSFCEEQESQLQQKFLLELCTHLKSNFKFRQTARLQAKFTCQALSEQQFQDNNKNKTNKSLIGRQN